MGSDETQSYFLKKEASPQKSDSQAPFTPTPPICATQIRPSPPQEIHSNILENDRMFRVGEMTFEMRFSYGADMKIPGKTGLSASHKG